MCFLQERQVKCVDTPFRWHIRFFWDSTALEQKSVMTAMFEEVAIEAAGMLVFLFLLMISLIAVCSWMVMRRGDTSERTSTRAQPYCCKLEVEPRNTYTSSEKYTIFHSLVKAMEEEQKKWK